MQDVEEFRAQVRGWLADNLAGEFAALKGLGGPGREHEAFEERRAWNQRLAAAGLTCLGWPEEHGGRGLSTAHRVAFYEEYARADAPDKVNHFGEELLGPTLIAFGTPQQQRRFLPRIRDVTELWCQGYSEPGAGSDLASVATTAELDGDQWVINGQKVWTSLAHLSQWCFVLARTEKGSQRHAGLSYLLVPLDQPGVQIRPIVQITGTAEFNEVFFDDARTSAGNVVGRVGDGWSTAMTLLGFERGSHIATAAIDFERDLQRLCELARDRGLHTDPRVRDGLAWCYARVQIMRYRGYRDLTLALTGRPPGAEAAITKVIWSEYFRRYTDLAVEILGLEALGPRGPGNGGARLVPEAGTPNSPACWMDELLYARAATIYAGSSQIQRNVIGERLLGLPKEPRPEVLC